MSVKLLTEHHLEFLRYNEGCTGSSESTLVKIPHCWKSGLKRKLNNDTGKAILYSHLLGTIHWMACKSYIDKIYFFIIYTYSKTCLKRPFNKKTKNWFSRLIIA